MTTTVSACCGAEVETRYSIFIDGNQYTCTKCRLVNCYVVERPTPTNPPTETVSDLERKILAKIGQCKQPIGYSCEYCSALYDVLSMLRQPSEHDLELIKEGHQRSDRDTRRGV